MQLWFHRDQKAAILAARPMETRCIVSLAEGVLSREKKMGQRPVPCEE